MTRKRRPPKIFTDRGTNPPQIKFLNVDQFMHLLGEQKDAEIQASRQHLAEVDGAEYARAGERTREVRRRQRNDLQEGLLELLNRIGDQRGIPPLSRDQALNLGGALRSMTDSQAMGGSKYEPVFDPERPLKNDPTVNVQLTWVDTRTGQSLFTMEPMVMTPGAKLHLQPLDEWDHAQVIVEVLEINPPGYEDYLQHQYDAPTPYVGQQKFHIRGLQGHFDFQGLRTSCLMVFPNDQVVTGLARCHPDDEYDLSTGRKTAFARALSQVIGDPSVRQLIWDDYFDQYPEDKIARSAR